MLGGLLGLWADGRFWKWARGGLWKQKPCRGCAGGKGESPGLVQSACSEGWVKGRCGRWPWANIGTFLASRLSVAEGVEVGACSDFRLCVTPPGVHSLKQIVAYLWEVPCHLL